MARKTPSRRRWFTVATVDVGPQATLYVHLRALGSGRMSEQATFRRFPRHSRGYPWPSAVLS